jgi:hypothetical protein
MRPCGDSISDCQVKTMPPSTPEYRGGHGCMEAFQIRTRQDQRLRGFPLGPTGFHHSREVFHLNKSETSAEIAYEFSPAIFTAPR